jgi:hypothetical protein
MIVMEHKSQSVKTMELKFAIQGIQIFNFSLDTSPKHQTMVPNHPYTFEINARGLVDITQKIIGIDFMVKIFTDIEKEDKVCELSLRMAFIILNFDEVVTFKETAPIIPDVAMQHLIALTVSTTRGILFEKLQGSFLSKITLPIFDVTKLNKTETNTPLIQ